MPFDILKTYKVNAKLATIEHSWTIRPGEPYIEAGSCPRLQVEGEKLSVPADPKVRQRCGT
jgi:hypothetical protein